jgi:REP element-mobilizing transposase RayT
MPQSLAWNLIHLIFSVKYRKRLILPRVRPKLYGYMSTVLEGMDCQPIEIGGVDDHVHLLFALSRSLALKDAVEETKKSSSRWMKSPAGIGHRDFYWQGGYAAFSVSASNQTRVANYIRNQEEHHRKMTFEEELKKLLDRHGVKYDERYLLNE